jgi:hypothetical protein
MPGEPKPYPPLRHTHPAPRSWHRQGHLPQVCTAVLPTSLRCHILARYHSKCPPLLSQPPSPLLSPCSSSPPSSPSPASSPPPRRSAPLSPRQDRLRCIDTCAALIFAVQSPCDPTRYRGLGEVLRAQEKCAREACPVSRRPSALTTVPGRGQRVHRLRAPAQPQRPVRHRDGLQGDAGRGVCRAAPPRVLARVRGRRVARDARDGQYLPRLLPDEPVLWGELDARVVRH